MSDESTTLLGGLSVEAALVAGRRQVTRIVADQDMDWRRVEPVRRVAKTLGLTIEKQPRATLDALAGTEKHGGVIAVAGPRTFESLDELVAPTGGDRFRGWLAMLDGVEDPFNFAHAVRALWAAGCDGLLVRPRNWNVGDAAGTVVRASAGATELIPTALVDAPLDAIAFAHEHGLQAVATATGEGSIAIYDAELHRPTLLLIGGEHRGLQRAAVEAADVVAQVPYGRDYDPALGTVAAASAIAFEILRQRAVAAS